ncbi:translin [Chrysoperla carnea]|uniref:translin n=1 Tax=Chrysoperla carnea TaxID=189513 RepID=UPI001D094826|nr:translin [Chrysoperla carnea]
MAKIMTEIFGSFQEYLNTEQELREQIRETVRDIDRISREIVTLLQVIHQEQTADTEIPNTCLKARKYFDEVRVNYIKLASVVPQDQYYRFHDQWKFVTQRLAFLIALTIYLEVGILVSRETVAEILGVKSRRDEGFHLDLEDYLMGLLQLSSELSRFAVNSVTYGDYNRPLEISRFVAELNAGFRLLNLKNDSLRKRFDALKYDVKKIEEVVYDLSIRGLKPNTSTATPTSTAAPTASISEKCTTQQN